jgi:hypothetical protein
MHPGFIRSWQSERRALTVSFLLSGVNLLGMARELIEVICPCCLSTLKIDAEFRAVISHTEPERKPVIEDLAVEVAKLKGAAGRREEAFQKSFAAEKNQGQLLNRKFDELLKQAKENPDFGKKPRDIDL